MLVNRCQHEDRSLALEASRADKDANILDLIEQLQKAEARIAELEPQWETFIAAYGQPAIRRRGQITASHECAVCAPRDFEDMT